MKTYRYLYYNLYRIWLKKKDERKDAHINAVLTITLTLFMNFYNIPLILLVIYKREIIHMPEINNEKIWIPIIMIIAGILNYIILGRKEQHNKIIEEFKMEDKGKRKKGILFTVLYLIFSLGTPFFIGFFSKPI